jgi:O-antigen ligase
MEPPQVAITSWVKTWLRLDQAARRNAVPDLWALLSGCVTFAAVAAVGLADGGLFPRTWRLATLAFVAVAAAALLARPRIVLTRREVSFVLALAGYAAWTLASATWSERSGLAVVLAERALLYTTATLAILMLAHREKTQVVLAALVAGITVTCAYGLAIRLFDPPPPDRLEGNLLYQPLGYANAVGIYAAMGVAVTTGLAVTAAQRVVAVLALVPMIVLLPALWLTSSRGSWLALAMAGLLAAAFGGRRTWLLSVSGVIVAAALLAAASVGGRPDLGYRQDYWQVAWSEYRQNPILGSGGGTYVDYWLSERPHDPFTRTAHSLYLQTLGELGPVGLALALAIVAVPILALRKRRDGLTLAAAAGFMAWALHTGTDFDWEIPAATLAALVCALAMLVSTRPQAATTLTPATRAALLALLAAVVAFVAWRLSAGTGLT